ncbi:MAG: BamA/TamA family outer membrane protein [Vicinamibacterales bacterium]
MIRSACLILLLVCGAATGVGAQAAPGPGVVGEVRVHGNHTTPDADVLALVGDVVGQPATDTLIADIAARLQQSGRFDGVDVRKRYRSIDNPDDILLMIVIDEVPGISALDLTPGPWKRFTSTGMFLPVLHYDDGYGFTYGARVSFVNLLGRGSRMSMPFTWGGERQARVQLERGFQRGRLFGDAGIGRKENPHYEIGDTRTGAHARLEGSIQKWLRVGGGGGIEDVQFGEVRDRLGRGGADVTLDTRVDPAYPRNAVHATFGVEHLSFDAGHSNRKTTDVRVYIGLIGQTVLSVRGLSIASSEPLPAYEQSLLGGDSTLRGYETGYQANDNLAAASAELRVPLTSPLSVGRFGLKAFVDAGAAYAAGGKMADQKLDRGYGGGVYLHLTILSLELDVARSEAGDTRLHFGMGVTFR